MANNASPGCSYLKSSKDCVSAKIYSAKDGRKTLLCFLVGLLVAFILTVGVTVGVTLYVVNLDQLPETKDCVMINEAVTRKEGVMVNASSYDLGSAKDRAGIWCRLWLEQDRGGS